MNSLANIFLQRQTSPISLIRFKDSGWSDDDIITFCNMCEYLRSAYIVQKSSDSITREQYIKLTDSSIKHSNGYKNSLHLHSNLLFNHALTNLLSWLEAKLDTTITPSFSFTYYLCFLASRIYVPNFIPHIQPPNVTELLISPDDFRELIIEIIGHILTTNTDPFSFAPRSSIDTKNTTYAEAERELLRLQAEYDKLRLSEPTVESLPPTITQCTRLAKKWAEWAIELFSVDDDICEYTDYIDSFPDPFDLTKHILYIYRGNIPCTIHQHDITCATGSLLTDNNQTVQLNILYCRNCDRYLLSYDEYMHYLDQYKFLIGNIQFMSGETDSDHGNFREYSTLMLCGYNVNQVHNLSTPQRHYILKNLVDLGFIRKDEIIQKIHQFININGAQPRNANAVSKWREDLEFIRNYNLDSQPQVQISDIQKYKK